MQHLIGKAFRVKRSWLSGTVTAIQEENLTALLDMGSTGSAFVSLSDLVPIKIIDDDIFNDSSGAGRTDRKP